MSNDPYDRYSRASSLKANFSKLVDRFPLDDDDDDPREAPRTRRKKARVKLDIYALADENLELLAPRHREVVELLLKGYSAAYVAEDLGLKVATVEMIIRTAYRRLVKKAK